MGALPKVGEQFGSFRVLQAIGRGGMGLVYRAEHVGLGREVALKLLAPELSDAHDARDRFMREASTLARLDSPHVISVHDAGEHDGWLYIATQFVPGGDLQQRLDRAGAVELVIGLRLVADVASGLEAAHRVGIVHRDIKPSNVLLGTSEGRPHAWLCDFGISRLEGSDATMTKGVIGTLGYMAPERHEGDMGSVAGDIYSLGCLLWATLTGTAPYAGGDFQVARHHLESPAPQLAGSAPQILAINAILARALAKEPQERYSSAADMALALRAAAALSELSPQPPPPGGEPRRAGPDAPRRGRRTGLALVGLVLVALVAAGAVVFWSLPRHGANPAPSVAGAGGPSATPGARDATGAATCWNGTVTDSADKCPVPSGAQGVAWAFPDVAQHGCTLDDTAASYYCYDTNMPWLGDDVLVVTWAKPVITATEPWLVDSEVVGVRGTFEVDGGWVGQLHYMDYHFTADCYTNTKAAAEECLDRLRVRPSGQRVPGD